ncbi:MAG: hypothetical protein NTV46_20895 [Verrucomicrobia bacterium]|nr:hypothetical protein [Verrucomicrobiota bacterium]
MSWFSKNYEKVALAGAIVMALGLAVLGWTKSDGVKEDFGYVPKGAGINDTAVSAADLIPKALQSMKLDHSLTQGMAGDRPVDLFTGIALFLSNSNPDKPLDPLTGPPIHPPIPNTWWLEHRLDPGFADSPKRDPDSDGFSNMEEFLAKTDPTDSKSFPALIAKLMYVKDESLAWVIRPGYGDGGKFPFSYEDSKKQLNKNPPGEMIAPNEVFFSKGPMAKRFKLLGSEVRKEMSPKTHVEMEVTIVRIEDQRPNKKGAVYELPSPILEIRKNDFLHYDRTAVFSLEALGLNGTEFKVEEYTTFALPPNAPKKDFLLKKVDPESVTVEYTDAQGALKSLKINKGSVAQKND